MKLSTFKPSPLFFSTFVVLLMALAVPFPSSKHFTGAFASPLGNEEEGDRGKTQPKVSIPENCCYRNEIELNEYLTLETF